MIYKTQPTETSRPHSLSWAQLRAMQHESELRQRIESQHRDAGRFSLLILAAAIVALLMI